MARLENFILGEVRGKLNNMVFKKLNGKNIISIRPRKYRVKRIDKPTVKDKFSYTAKLAGKVNQNPFLRCIWDSVNIDGSSPYHKVLKINLGLSSCDKLNIKNIITPPGVIVEPGSIRFEMEYITIAYNSKAIDIIHKVISFNNCIIYIALVAGKNPDKKEFKWTSTYCVEIEL